MPQLKISKDVTLPLDTVTQTIAILAKRRVGKSYTMRRLVEQLFKAHQQVIIVDPKGDQWGVRSSADGKSPGFPVIILGGEHGDVPLEANAGEVVANLVVKERVSVLLDISLFRKHEVATFMTGFMENLYRLKAQEQYRTPCMLVIDEADAIAPQKPQRGEERMLGAAEDIVRRGGQRGIGCTLVTQRSAVLNKNVLTQAQVLIVLRTIAPQDLAAMNAWIDVHGEAEQRKILMASLPSLPIGDAWIWSPGWPTEEGIFQRTHILPIDTFDSGATPKVGSKPVVPKNLADVDLGALKEQMAATIEKAKQNNPRALQEEIKRLKAQLAKGEPTIARVVEREVKRVEVPVLGKKNYTNLLRLIKKFEKAAPRFETLSKMFDEAKEDFIFLEKKLKGIDCNYSLSSVPLRGTVKMTDDSREKITAKIVQDSLSIHEKMSAKIAKENITQLDSLMVQNPDIKITGPEQNILDALAWFESIGKKELENAAVASVAGYSYDSGGYKNPRASLRTKNMVEYLPSGLITLTDMGRARARTQDAPLTTEALQERVKQILTGPECKILEVIVSVYPGAITNEEVASTLGYAADSGGYKNPRSRLRTLGLVEYVEPRSVKASDILFI